MKKKGKITPNGVVLKTYENATVVFLTEQGIDIDLIPTSNAEGVHTPDIKMNGLEWEMKAPLGVGKQLMENTIQRALKQSENIIVDEKTPVQVCKRTRKTVYEQEEYQEA